MPSTIQFFHFVNGFRLGVVGKNELAMLTYLREHASPGDVVLARQEHVAVGDSRNLRAAPIHAMTNCRTVLASLYAESFAAPEELTRRSQDLNEFWGAWAKGKLRTDLLTGYQVEYLVLDGARWTVDANRLPRWQPRWSWPRRTSGWNNVLPTPDFWSTKFGENLRKNKIVRSGSK